MCNVICKVKIIFLSFSILFAFSAVTTAEDFSCKIIEANRLGTIKCVLTVRLSKKVSEETLRQLAIKLRDKQPKRYDRMFITYYLPGMTVGTVAWATTHFNPKLDVRILSMTAEEEQNILKKNISGKIIGIWLDEFHGKITIIKKSSGYVIQTKHKDGSGGTKNVIDFKARGKLAFKEKGNTRGEYYVIEKSGDLSIYDSLGLIITMRAVK